MSVDKMTSSQQVSVSVNSEFYHPWDLLNFLFLSELKMKMISSWLILNNFSDSREDFCKEQERAVHMKWLEEREL
jgi:hypothetical protein